MITNCSQLVWVWPSDEGRHGAVLGLWGPLQCPPGGVAGPTLLLGLHPLLGIVLLPHSVDLLEQGHGKSHAKKLYHQYTHGYGAQKVLIIV